MARDRAARPEARPLRLFAAVDIPPAATRAVVEAVEPWKEQLGSGRWVRPENWHITMKFLGRTYPRLLDWVHEACREAAAEIRPFRVSLSGLGAFPSVGRARVLWAGMEDEGDGFRALASALDRRLEKEFKPEKRPFTAHLTVARFDPPIRLKEHAEELAVTEIRARRFTIGELVLYRSHLSPRGARYEPLERFPLRG
ncbi:MAG TPA: RNA 2',3'-cyclic phosphodiesterase [Actinomycetota bacterium]|nr:RNA 2',3'-cyclic phosphodiesterase [Actinomycetota bacterium]